MRVFFVYAVALVWTGSAVVAMAAPPSINAGAVTVDSGEESVAMRLFATGSTAVSGFALRAQLVAADGGGPTFASVSFTPSLWDAGANSVGGGPVDGAPDFAEASIFLNGAGATVPANGRVVTLRINTVGVPAGTYQLALKGTEIGSDTAFILPGGEELSPDVRGDTIRVVSGRSVWTADADGTWGDGSKWSMGSPSGAGVGARFTQTPSAPRTVTVAVPVVLGTLRMESVVKYTVTGAKLTFTGGGAPADLTVAGGAQEIASDVAFDSPASVSVATGASLKLSGRVSGVPLASLWVEPGGTLDIGGTGLTVSHAAGDGTVAAEIAGRIAAAMHHGRWDSAGITSSAAAGDPRHATAVGYSDGATQTTFRYTAYGDANLDGVVDSTDLSMMSGHAGLTNVGWAGGDFNYDGVCNAGDYALFGVGATFHGPGFGVTTPEPCCAGLVIATMAGWFRRRRA